MEKQKIMTRLLTVLLALALLVPGLPSPAAAEELIYESSFSGGRMDGWYVDGGDSLSLSVMDDNTLKITGRTIDWEGPRRAFNLLKDQTFHVSVEVYQDSQESVDFLITASFEQDGGVQYANLTKSPVKKGEWTTLSGDIKALFSYYTTLYVETLGSPDLDFEIRNFRVTGEKQFIQGFMETVQQSFREALEEKRAACEALPVPDIMKHPDMSSIFSDTVRTIPEMAAIEKFSFENGTLFVRMNRKVDAIDILEMNEEETEELTNYFSLNDRKNREPNRQGSVEIKNVTHPNVRVIIPETIKKNNTVYHLSSSYILDPETKELKLDLRDMSWSPSLKALTPYDKIKDMVCNEQVVWRTNDTVEYVLFDLYSDSDNPQFLQIKTDCDQAGNPSCILTDRGVLGDYELHASSVTDGEGHVARVELNLLNAFTVQFASDRDPKPYLTFENSDPDFWTWKILLLLEGNGGWTETTFRTRDLLFLQDENGVITWNKDARDLDGHPMPWSEVTELLYPEFFTAPVT